MNASELRLANCYSWQMYAAVRWLITVVLRVFFRHRAVVGNESLPDDGAVLFLGNHPNSLIDPMLIIASCGRKVHFAAKATLFRIAPFRPVLRALGAVPIHRRVDTGTSTVDNRAAFDAMQSVLAEGGAIGMFPEGLSHDDSQLASLRTGAARLALAALASGRVQRLTIVPCGLTFTNPKRFRSSVLVQYGDPIVLTAPEAVAAASAAPTLASAAAPAAETDPAAVRALTDLIDQAIRRLTVNSQDWDTARALDTVRRLYQPDGITLDERAELARRFNLFYPRVAAQPTVKTLFARVGAYQQRLDDLSLTDRELLRHLSKRDVTARALENIGLLSLWVPLAIPGAPMHVPSLVFAKLAGRALSPQATVVSTAKLLTGLALSALMYAAVIGALAWHGHLGWAVVATILLPLSGWATVRVLDRFYVVRRAVLVLSRQVAFRREVDALRQERALLAREIVAIVPTLMPSDVAPMFGPDHPAREPS